MGGPFGGQTALRAVNGRRFAPSGAQETAKPPQGGEQARTAPDLANFKAFATGQSLPDNCTVFAPEEAQTFKLRAFCARGGPRPWKS
eukprot:6125559-Karenia_brevis.AAC.1